MTVQASRTHTTFVRRSVLAALALAVAVVVSIGSSSQASAMGTVIFVDLDATGAQDGTSWTDAVGSVQAAIDIASDGDQIWVASGLYSTCHVVDVDVELFGGFDPVAAPDLGTRDPDVHLTYLTGANICVATVDVLDGVDATISGFRVIDGTQAIQLGDGEVTLHRITMNGAERDGIGAVGTDLTIRDVSIVNSGLLVDSRAVEVREGTVDVDGLEITSVFGRGAFFYQTGGVMRDITIITTTLDCIEFQPAPIAPLATMVVVDLTTAGCGQDGVVIGQQNVGGVAELNVDVTILNSTIGSAMERGLVIGQGSKGRIENSIIRASALAEIDAFSLVGPPGSAGDVFIVGSTVAGGSGIELIDGDGRVHFQNTIFDSPVAPAATTTSSFQGSLVPGSGGSAAWSYGGTVDLGGNLDGDPRFVGSPNDLRVQSGSPAIDAGGNAAVSFDVHDVDEDGDTSERTPDLDLEKRIRNGTVDIGAYEFVPDGLTVFDDPCVVFDSDDAGQAPFVGAETRDVQVTGSLSGQGGASGCVPDGASSVVFRVSSVDPITEGNLRMWATGGTVAGGAGVVNYGVNALNNANTVTVPVSALGSVTIEANAGTQGVGAPTTDVRLVAIAYYSPDVDPTVRFVPVNPCAITDSRTNKNANDNFDGPANDGFWSVGDAFPDVDVVGNFAFGQGGLNGVGNPDGNPTSCGVPANADAVMVNVVAIAPTGSGFLSVGTGGTNPIAEATTPFAVLSPGMANGTTTIVNLNGQDKIAVDIDGDVGSKVKVRVEVLGYYVSDGSGDNYLSVSPCTAFDSRVTRGATGSFVGLRQHGPGNATVYQVGGDDIPVGQGGVVDAGGGFGDCGVPDGASAVLMNFEAVNAVQEGNFWVSAGDQSSTGGVLNFNNLTPKMNNANAVVVPLDAQGRIKVEINAGSFTPLDTPIAEARGIILGYFS